MRPRIVVVGSINLDLVVRVPTLPRPGETVGGGTFAQVPGGKGANQAVACARLGADVTLVGAVGRDAAAEDALAGLRQADVTLRLEQSAEHTGVALIQVDAEGETTIAVAPGANESLGTVEHQYEVSEDRAVLAPGFRVLDERERAILHLRFFEGLTQSQIAQQVGISQMHVSRLIRRSLEKIREEIAADQPA